MKTFYTKSMMAATLGCLLSFLQPASAQSSRTSRSNVIPVNSTPQFTGGSVLTICPNSSNVSIDSILQITDLSVGQTETFTVTGSPSHGSITAGGTATSGTNVRPSGWAYTPTFGYLGTDQFTIKVTDNQGANSSRTFNVSMAIAGIISITANTTTACTNDSVTLTANGVNGINAVVKWFTQSRGTGVYAGTGITIKLPVGSKMYYGLVTTACGDTAEASIGITQKLSATYTKTDVTCFGTATGSLSNITVSGGTDPYLVSVKPTTGFTNTTTIGGLKASTYRIYMQDNAGCTGFTDAVAITQPATALSVTASKRDALCNKAATGVIYNISAAGGVAPYMYTLSTTSSYSSADSITGLKAGTYRVAAKDALGCVALSSQLFISQPAATVISYQKSDVSCSSPNSGSITNISATGGSGSGYTFSLSPTLPFTNTTGFNNLKAGNYRVYCKDGTGCISFTAIITINSCSSRTIQPAEMATIKTLQAYPNPSKGQFMLQLNSKATGTATIAISNQSGMVVASKKVNLSAAQNAIVIDMSRQAPGTYFVKVMTDKGVEVTKVVMVP